MRFWSNSACSARSYASAFPARVGPQRDCSANGANGPVISTLLTLLVALAIYSSFSGKQAGKDDHNRSRYADINSTDIPTCADFLASVGLTLGSA